jgi:protein-S-isoprenylcysteine O-methyltransferase Ste14
MFFELLVLLGYVLFAFLGGWNLAISGEHSTLVKLCGVFFTTITLAFMVFGIKAAGKEASVPRKDTKLYQGIYKHMRHPQTLGEMLSWFGIAMVLNSLPLLVFSTIWVPAFTSYTIIEDNDLAVRFGEQYVNYTKTVGIFWKKSANGG